MTSDWPSIWARHRRAILGVALIALILAAAVNHKLRQRVRAERVAALQVHLQDEDPKACLEAAMAIIHIEPYHRGARLTQVRSLLEQGRRTEARQILSGLETDPEVQWTDSALALHADSYFDEAAEVLAAATPATIESVRESLETLVQEGSTRRKQITISVASEGLRAILEAREADLQAMILWRLRQARQLELAKNQSVRFQERVDMLGTEVQSLSQRIDQLNERARSLAAKGLAKRPLDARPRLVTFHTCLRAGEPGEARHVAAEIATQSKLSRVDAGEVADTLLNLDRFYALTSTEADMGLARTLLACPQLIGADAIRFELARASLAQRDEKPQAAAAILQELLNHYPANPRATCMLANAMIRLGRPQEAVALLEPFNERTHSAEGKISLGEALLAAGDTVRGLEVLRQSLVIEPSSLPAQLTLIEALLKHGGAVEAEPNILAAMTLSPDNPRVQAFRAMVLVEKLDRKGLVALLQRPATWRHAALAAAMALDDRALADSLADEYRAQWKDEPLGLIAAGFHRAAARQRAETAALVAREVLKALDADPMRWPEPPRVWSLPNAGKSAAGESAKVEPLPDSLAPNHLVPMPLEVAAQLIDTALSLEPSQPVLLDLGAQLDLWLNRPDSARERLARLTHLGSPLSPTAQSMQAYLAGSESPLPKAATPTQQWIALATALRRKNHAEAIEALAQLLREHPWAEAAVWLALRDTLASGSAEAAGPILEEANKINPTLAVLSRGRLNLALGRAGETLREMTALLHDAEVESEVRTQATEIAARANAALGRVELAIGGFETLSFAATNQRVEMRICAADLLQQAGKTRAAAATVGSLLSEIKITPRQLDALLVRAQSTMAASRFQAFLNRMLQVDPDNLILMVYKVRTLADSEDGAHEAQQTAKRLVELRPGSPRVKMVQAYLAARSGQGEEARAIYNDLVHRGVLSPAAGQAALEQMKRAAIQPTNAPEGESAE